MNAVTGTLLRATGRHRGRWLGALAAAMVFVSVGVTLAWPQFSGDSEDLVAQTVLEMRHGGPWWVPTLEGEARLRKPPLTAWITALAARPQTIAHLKATQDSRREEAYRFLCLEMRWPALLAGGVMLMLAAATARLLGGWRLAATTAFICGTSLLFLRFAREATSDVYLAMWVAAANFFLVLAMLRRRIWLGCCGAGIALGLALMTKGPVALVETVFPVLLYAWDQRLGRGREERREERGERRRERRWGLPVLAGMLLAVAIAAPWFISVGLNHPHSIELWNREVLNEGVNVRPSDPWYSYLALFADMLPWLPLFAAGLWLSLRKLGTRKPIALAVFLLLGPILAMSFFPARKERYLLPMSGPAAMMAAYALQAVWRGRLSKKPATQIVMRIQWGVLAVFAIGIPVYGARFGHWPEGRNWYSWPLALGAIAGGMALWFAAVALHKRRPVLGVATGAAMMLLINAVFVWGWSGDVAGLSEMKVVADAIRQVRPEAAVVYYDPPPWQKPVTLDLDIYLDRPVPVIRQFPAQPVQGRLLVVLGQAAHVPPPLSGYDVLRRCVSRNHEWYVLEPKRP